MSSVKRTRRTFTFTRSWRRTTAAVAALALATTLASCGDGDDEGGSDGPSESTGSTEPTTAPTEPSESTEPTETEPPDSETPLGTGVAPATGRLVEIDALSLRLPQGWRLIDRNDEGFIARPRVYNLDYLTVSGITNDGRTSSPAEALRDYVRTEQRPPQIKSPIEIDGVPMFYGTGKVQRSTWVEAVGSDSTNWTVSITFDSSPQLTTLKERRELADSVLATVDMVE